MVFDALCVCRTCNIKAAVPYGIPKGWPFGSMAWDWEYKGEEETLGINHASGIKRASYMSMKLRKLHSYNILS